MKTRTTFMISATVVALAMAPTLVNAAPDVGGIIGRPADAAAGGSGGGTVGAGFREAQDDDNVVIEQRRVRARPRSCARDALGVSKCEDMRR